MLSLSKSIHQILTNIDFFHEIIVILEGMWLIQ